MKFLFFFLGVPMMIMSFFQAADVLPYVQQYNLLVAGQIVELSAEQQAQLQLQVDQLLQNTRTMPAFGVTLPDELDADKLDNVYVCLKFDKPLSVNDLPFDELCFRVDKDCQGFNLNRGNKGVFQGRAIYVEILDGGTMNELYDFVSTITNPLQTEASKHENALPELLNQQETIENPSETPTENTFKNLSGNLSERISENPSQAPTENASENISENPS